MLYRAVARDPRLCLGLRLLPRFRPLHTITTARYEQRYRNRPRIATIEPSRTIPAPMSQNVATLHTASSNGLLTKSQHPRSHKQAPNSRGGSMKAKAKTDFKPRRSSKPGPTPYRSSKSGPPTPHRSSKPEHTTPRFNKRGPQPISCEKEKRELEYGLARLLAKYKLPTPEEYPSLWPNPEQKAWIVFDRTRQTLRASIQENFDDDTTGRPPSADHRLIYVRRTLKLDIPLYGTLTVVGDGIDTSQSRARSGANHAVGLHAMAMMHEKGLLQHLFKNRPSVETLAQLEDVRNGIPDIFNYAASHNCPLQYTAQRHGTKKYGIIAQMPEHDIRVFTTSRDLAEAERHATFEFKRQAELYHQRQGTDPFAAKDQPTLNTENAVVFLARCERLGEAKVSLNLTRKRGGVFGAEFEVDGTKETSPMLFSQGGEKNAKKIIALAAALTLLKNKPKLQEQLAKLQGEGQRRHTAPPVDVLVSEQTSREMVKFNHAAQRMYPSRAVDTVREQKDGARQHSRRVPLTGSALEERSIALQRKMADYQSRDDLAPLRHTISQLPMKQYADQVLQIVQNNIYCVIIGATGSGKTTQVPQILLDHAIHNGTGASCNIICTQPRRIAATSVAKRVADERAETLQDTVGYHVRFDPKLPKVSGSILYCTTGILLQQLQGDHDEVYDRVSHLVIDEVHERDIQIDFLLVVIKKTMALRVQQGKTVPRIVLMSATIDAERFAKYFKGSLPVAEATDCPSLSVPGRTFPVKEFYLGTILDEMKQSHGSLALKSLRHDKKTAEYLRLETAGINSINDTDGEAPSQPTFSGNWKKLAAVKPADEKAAASKEEALFPKALVGLTVAHIAKTTPAGAILVFVPGLQEITDLDAYLRQSLPLGVDFNEEAQFKLFMLHSSIPNQNVVFDDVPAGCRKIILSTNIAETSVTIPDVQFVVDTGKFREKQYDQERRIEQLQCTWVSKSNVKQRAGRAGRVQNGNYYALYSEARYESMRATGLPELLRSELQRICLDVTAQTFKMPVREFLAEAIEPPAAAAVDLAINNLQNLGALTENGELTPLGRVLFLLPVHPTLGKMIILGIIFRCLEPMIILGAAAESRGLFVNPVLKEDRRKAEEVRKKFSGNSNSDQIAVLRAFRWIREIENTQRSGMMPAMLSNFLHYGAYNSIKSTAEQIETILCEAGLIPSSMERATMYGGSMLNENSDSDNVVKALLLAGLGSNLAARKKSTGKKSNSAFMTRDEWFSMIARNSINYGVPEATERGKEPLLIYQTVAMASDGGAVTLRDTTQVSPLAALLFANQAIRRYRTTDPMFMVDKWIPFIIGALPSKQTGMSRDDAGSRPHVIASQIAMLRAGLDRMLAHAFADLAKRQPLADDRGREELARGVARILDVSEGLPPVQANYQRSSSSQRSSYQEDFQNRGNDVQRKGGYFKRLGNDSQRDNGFQRGNDFQGRNDFQRRGNDFAEGYDAQTRDDHFEDREINSPETGLFYRRNRAARARRTDSEAYLTTKDLVHPDGGASNRRPRSPRDRKKAAWY